MSAPLPDFPLADADRCVKCALCLPHCPTWRETRDEAESPRGRIALMQGFATGALDITPTLAGHFDRCLDCRACEAVCPAEVPYGKLIDATHRVLQQQGHRDSGLARLFAWCLRSPMRLRVLHVLLWCAQTSGLLWLMRQLGPLRRLARLLPRIGWPHAQLDHPMTRSERGRVDLFLGCIARITEPQVTTAAAVLLRAAGYDVHIPANQTCCGALDQHAGRLACAAALAGNNLEAFGAGSTPVLSSASGCGATLAEYARLSDHPYAAAFATRHADISRFLNSSGALAALEFAPWPVRVVLHQPCTLRNVLKSERDALALLQRIPQLDVKVLPPDTGCCGAAGSYLLNQPQLSDTLGGSVAARLAALQPAALVTSNVGCAMQLAAALARNGRVMPVYHPVEVLARQLRPL